MVSNVCQPGQDDVREFRVEESDGGGTNVHEVRVTDTDGNHVFGRFAEKSLIARHEWMRVISSPKLLRCQWVAGEQMPNQSLPRAFLCLVT